MSEVSRLRETLAAIAQLASEAVSDSSGERSDVEDAYIEDAGAGERHAGERDRNDADSADASASACTPKSLPGRLLVQAATTARRVNPMNAPLANAPLAGPDAPKALESVQEPLQIAVLTSKYWGPAPRRLTVSFMESTPADLRTRIIAHLNAWTRTGGVSFVETRGTGEVRISRGQGGYWSYLGTDILHIPRNRPTMNLEAFTMNTPEPEYRRVVRHEAGHTLGFPHEHMRRALVARIDRQKAYDYFRRTQGWDRRTVDEQVLTPLDERSLLGTPADQTSIMSYQLPGSITQDGRPIAGGRDINRSDFDFIARIYPKAGRAPTAAGAGSDARADGAEPWLRVEPVDAGGPEQGRGAVAEEWDPSEDVEVTV